MNQSKLYRVFFVVLILMYFTLLGLSIGEIIFPFYETWFSFALIFLAFALFPRFILYGVDTNLWIGSILLLSGCFGLINFYLEISWIFSLAGYLFSATFPSIFMFMFFRQIFHLKLFTFGILFVIILIVYDSGLLSLPITISSLAALLVLVLSFGIKTILNNMRKV